MLLTEAGQRLVLGVRQGLQVLGRALDRKRMHSPKGTLRSGR